MWKVVENPKFKANLAVYTVKCNSHRTIEWYQAKLVGKGYTQTNGVDD